MPLFKKIKLRSEELSDEDQVKIKEKELLAMTEKTLTNAINSIVDEERRIAGEKIRDRIYDYCQDFPIEISNISFESVPINVEFRIKEQG